MKAPISIIFFCWTFPEENVSSGRLQDLECLETFQKVFRSTRQGQVSLDRYSFAKKRLLSEDFSKKTSAFFLTPSFWESVCVLFRFEVWEFILVSSSKLQSVQSCFSKHFTIKFRNFKIVFFFSEKNALFLVLKVVYSSFLNWGSKLFVFV